MDEDTSQMELLFVQGVFIKWAYSLKKLSSKFCELRQLSKLRIKKKIKMYSYPINPLIRKARAPLIFWNHAGPTLHFA